ncbi:MAG: hypothetical protein PHW53_03355 [Patescibacteria group bacterium]|nr:hypothetical protein [Patescibacteria group bacterium]
MEKQALQPNIIFRLVLAKTLFKSGLECCDTGVDIYNFSHGLIALHDALDNFSGAIASILNIALSRPSKFIDTLDSIEQYEKKSNSNFVLTSRNELYQLNTLRNSIKHQGIVPDIKHAKALIEPIVKFFKEYSRYYFDLEWDIISLADLIKNDTTKNALNKVEKFIGRGQHKEALNEMAIIKFQVFDEQHIRAKLDSRLAAYYLETANIEKLRMAKNIFPKREILVSDTDQRTRLLEWGIDSGQMQKFEDLTAEVGINNVNDWEYVLRHGSAWGRPNWTREISIFCFDFLIDAIIKHQRKDYGVRQVVIPWLIHIRAREEIKLYVDDKEIYSISKGEERVALIPGRVDDGWEIFENKDRLLVLMDKDGSASNMISGFFNEGDEDKIEILGK